MNYSYIVYASAIILLVYFVYKVIELWWYMRLLNKLPGPKPLIPLLGNAYELQKPEEVIFKILHEYGKIYGPLYKMTGMGNGAIFVRDPSDIEFFISGMKHLEKSHMYLCFSYWLETGLLTSTDEKWQIRRKILTPTFHFSILQQFTKTFIEHSEKIVEAIMKQTGKPIDVVPIVTDCTLHTICETALGVNLADQAKETNNYRDAIQRMALLTVYRVLRPWYYSRLSYLVSPKFYETIFTSKYLHNYSTRLINRRKQTFNVDNVKNITEGDVYRTKKKLAMLDMMLYAQANGAQIDDNGIREEVDTFIFEGHDTTSACATFTLMLLACNPSCQAKAVEELKLIFNDPTTPLTYDALNQMKYLERVIKESLRLYPSVPMIGRLLNETVVTPSGHTVPYNTNVMIRIYDLHRDPEIYPEPDKFDPDRFLPENLLNRHPYAFLPFSAGPRNCIGQKFAILELKAILSSILRNFILLPVDTPETITLFTGLILHTKGGVRVQFERRPEPI